MIVRRATLEDLPAYLPMGQAFHDASPMHQVIPFDPEGFSQFYKSALENPHAGMWITEVDGRPVGIAGALAYPMYFSPSHLVAQELWWWLAPEARGHGAGQAMYDAIEAWANEQDVSALFMIALEDERAPQMEKLYARKGFRPMERTFFKEVA